jgi:hypothetical protein
MEMNLWTISTIIFSMWNQIKKEKDKNRCGCLLWIGESCIVHYL